MKIRAGNQLTIPFGQKPGRTGAYPPCGRAPCVFKANHPANHPHETFVAQTLYRGIVTVLERRGFLQSIPGVTTGRIIAIENQYFLAVLISGEKLMGQVFRCPGDDSLGDQVAQHVHAKANALFHSIEQEVMEEVKPKLVEKNIAGIIFNPVIGLQPCFRVLTPQEDELHSVILGVVLSNRLSREEASIMGSNVCNQVYLKLLPSSLLQEAETLFASRLKAKFASSSASFGVVEGHPVCETPLPRLVHIFFPIDAYLNSFSRHRTNFQPAVQALWDCFNDSLSEINKPYCERGYPPFAFQIGALTPIRVTRDGRLIGLVFQIQYWISTDLRKISQEQFMPPLLDFAERMGRG